MLSWAQCRALSTQGPVCPARISEMGASPVRCAVLCAYGARSRCLASCCTECHWLCAGPLLLLCLSEGTGSVRSCPFDKLHASIQGPLTATPSCATYCLGLERSVERDLEKAILVHREMGNSLLGRHNVASQYRHLGGVVGQTAVRVLTIYLFVCSFEGRGWGNVGTCSTLRSLGLELPAERSLSILNLFLRLLFSSFIL